MKKSTPDTSNIPQTESVLSVGADLGGKLGCSLSILYCMAGLIIEFLLQNTKTKDIVGLFLMNILIVIFLASFPSTLLGITTGFVIGLLSTIFSHQISIKKFIILSSTICAIVVMALHLLIFDFSASSYKTIMQESLLELGTHIIDKYFYLIGIPSMVYIITGGWVGKSLYLKRPNQK